MLSEEILQYCLNNLDGTVLVNSWGEQGIFYNPESKLKRGVYILTVKQKDGENDSSSNLDRENVYRINLGVRKKTFIDMFGTVPSRPQKGGIVKMEFDFTQLDVIMPHPVYAWINWICVLNPSQDTFENLKPLIHEAYEFAKEKYSKRK